MKWKILWWIVILGGIYCIIRFPRPLFDEPLSTAVYDRQGRLLGAKIARDGQWRFGKVVQLPYKYQTCLLHYEDKRFFQHMGVDAGAIVASISHNLRSQKSRRGGSTITMQVMRMSLNNRRRNYLSKIEEATLSVCLELIKTKREILSLYASNAPFGGNVVGLDAACWRYFGKSPELLTWAESAMLAVLPNSPSLIHLSKNRSRLKEKRNRLLTKIYEAGLIDEITLALSMEEELPNAPIPLPSKSQHFIQKIADKSPQGGKYVSTVDLTFQEAGYETAASFASQNQVNQIDNLAILIVDNSTGAVLCYIGNSPIGEAGVAVDMIRAKRSSGSILKPLLYMAMLDEGLLCPKSLVPDIPLSINGYMPENFDKTFRGAVPADEALRRSLNIPFVLMLRKYGIGKAIQKFKKAGISTLNRNADYYGLSLILGGAEVNLWDVCKSYSNMAKILSHYTTNNGKYSSTPVQNLECIQNEIKSLAHYTQQNPALFSASAIYQCTEALKDLKRPDDEGLWEEFSSQRPIAWKTGTSFGHKDAWAVGFDEKYTIGVWVGNATGKSRHNLTGIGMAAPILFDVYNKLPAGSWFEAPWDDLVKVQVCNHSGNLAGVNCTNISEEYLNSSASKSLSCNLHQMCHLSCDGIYQVTKECATGGESEGLNFFVLPPEQAAYYKQQHPEYRDIPPFHPDCLDWGGENGRFEFNFIYPAEDTRIYMPKDVSGKQQAAVFRASHVNAGAKLYWHLDQKYLGFTEVYHTKEIKAPPGKHRVTLMDGQGIQVTRNFEVVDN
ncbi:MAG: penicillin-binding protein 1C [Saprospiraceae bacterium]|nr:penicillin-binding protein 1C [Saprospiraceae bacterium]